MFLLHFVYVRQIYLPMKRRLKEGREELCCMSSWNAAGELLRELRWLRSAEIVLLHVEDVTQACLVTKWRGKERREEFCCMSYWNAAATTLMWVDLGELWLFCCMSRR